MDKYVNRLTLAIGHQLKTLEKTLDEQSIEHVAIRFPRGFIRTRSYHEKRLSFLPDGVAKRNIAYTLQVTDVNRWMLNRFDLRGPAQSLFIKQAAITLISVLEAVLQTVWNTENPGTTKSLKFFQLINKTEFAGMLSQSTASALHNARQFRNQIHVQSVATPEWDRYGLSDYNKTIKTLQMLLDNLSTYYTAQAE